MSSAPRARRALLAVTLLSGAVVALLVDPVGPTPFAVVAVPVHSTISIFLPFLAILVVQDPRVGAVAHPVAVSAGLVVLGVAVALVGDAFCALAVGLRGGPWTGAAPVATGAVGVQVLTTLVGAAFGLLLGRAWLAMLADLVVPLGLWAATGALGWRAVQAWATPYGVVPDLLAGTASPCLGPRVVVVVGLWVAGLGALGRAIAVRRAAT